jgi:hypothetical protein
MPDAPARTLHIRSALLADYAKVERSGLLSIVGGGIADVHPTSLPTQLSLAVVAQLLPVEAIAGVLTLEVRRPTAESALTINGEFTLPIAGKLVNVALNLNLLVDTPGEWVVHFAFGDGQPTVELPFNVVLGQAPE